MNTYYISGPMTGIEDYNHTAFNAAERDLVNYLDSVGVEYRVINPARNFDGQTNLDRHVYLTLDLKQVLESDVIVLLPGWKTSPGANSEAHVAEITGKHFMVATLQASTGTYVFRIIDPPISGSSPAINTSSESVRGGVLDEAKQLITGDRNHQYGPPDQDFTRTAAMATGFGFSVNGKPLLGHHVAIFMNLLKISRLAWTPTKRDSWVDAAGYDACGFECATLEAERGELTA